MNHRLRRTALILRGIDVSVRVVEATFSMIRGALDGFWLGLMNDESLAAIADRYYRGEGHCGEDLYLDEAYTVEGMKDWEQAALTEHFPSSGHIVVTGAGAGREIFALLGLGYDAVGFECNRRLVATGRDLLRRKGHSPERLSWAPPNSWPTEASHCDAVVVGWGSYTHIWTRAARVSFLRGARASLSAGAPILVSFWSRTGASRRLRAIAWVGSAVRRVCGGSPLEIGDALNGIYYHVFTRDEITAELHSGGFTTVAYDDQPYARAVGRAR